MSTSLLIAQLRLQCSSTAMLLRAAAPEVKEYAAGWRDGGKKILRQGGRFASANPGAQASEPAAPQADSASTPDPAEAQSKAVLSSLSKGFATLFQNMKSAPKEFTQAAEGYYNKEVKPLLTAAGSPKKTLADLATKMLEDVQNSAKTFKAEVKQSAAKNLPLSVKGLKQVGMNLVAGAAIFGMASAVAPPLAAFLISPLPMFVLEIDSAIKVLKPLVSIVSDSALRATGLTKGEDEQGNQPRGDKYTEAIVSAAITGFASGTLSGVAEVGYASNSTAFAELDAVSEQFARQSESAASEVGVTLSKTQIGKYEFDLTASPEFRKLLDSASKVAKGGSQ